MLLWGRYWVSVLRFGLRYLPEAFCWDVTFFFVSVTTILTRGRQYWMVADVSP